jgi:hypothetical protein
VAIYQDTFYSQNFILQTTSGTAINLAGSTWTAALRVNVADVDPPLLTLTSAGGGIILPNGGTDGKLQIILTQAQTTSLPVGTLHSDFMRTDIVGASPQRYFGATFKVKQSVTRL